MVVHVPGGLAWPCKSRCFYLHYRWRSGDSTWCKSYHTHLNSDTRSHTQDWWCRNPDFLRVACGSIGWHGWHFWKPYPPHILWLANRLRAAPNCLLLSQHCCTPRPTRCSGSPLSDYRRLWCLGTHYSREIRVSTPPVLSMASGIAI